MKTRKIIALLLMLGLAFTCISCVQIEEQQDSFSLLESRMKSISELATMKCYYHNVAIYDEKDASGILFWKKDMHFWIEYSGIVELGIDASLVKIIDVKEDCVTIAIPNAKVLSKKVDEASLNKDSFIVDKKSAKISAEDEIRVFADAQKNMELGASSDKALLASAQLRAQMLIEQYVMNIGASGGKEYYIKWEYIDTEDNGSVNSTEETANSEEADESE